MDERYTPPSGRDRRNTSSSERRYTDSQNEQNTPRRENRYLSEDRYIAPRPNQNGAPANRDNSLARRRRQQERLKRRRKKKILRAVVLAGLLIVLILIILILKALFGFIGSLFTKDDKTEEVDATPTTVTASVLSGGDVILHSPIFESELYITGEDTYDFSPIFSYVKSDLEDADLTVLNLETTISDGDYSGYPLFKCPDEIATALKENGTDLCLLANNHIYDNRTDGLNMTMDVVEQNSLLFTGTRRTEEDPIYSVQDLNGIKVGILNYVFETGTSTDSKLINDLAVDAADAPLINSFNYENLDAFYAEVSTALEDMKNDGVEYTIAYIHWGNEYQLEEDVHQQEIAQGLCDLGINALIGGHPHVVQPVDLLTNTEGDHQMLCVYSVGNLLSNQRRDLISSQPNGHTEDGLLVKLSLEQTGEGAVSLTAVDFIPTWVYKDSAEANSEYFILPLDSTDELLEEVTDLDIEESINESLERTNEIIGEGVEKVQSALPLS